MHVAPPKRLCPQARLSPFRRVIVVNESPNPTFDYYLAPRLSGGIEVIHARLDEPSSLPAHAFEDALLLFCRYSSPAWLGLAERGRIAGVALMIDDDMPALMRDPSIPIRYRWKLWRRGVSLWPRLERSLGRLLVSTRTLASRYGDGDAILLPPVASEADIPPVPPRPAEPRLSFHATASHRAEQDWFEPVARALLSNHARLTIEIVADRSVARRWRGDPRIVVKPQRPWPEYRRDTALLGCGIMVAPLLPSDANAARAPVKRIDAARTGAALIVSDAAIYQPDSAEEALGMSIPLDRPNWISALGALIDDSERVERLALLNRSRILIETHRLAPLFARAPSPGHWTLIDPRN